MTRTDVNRREQDLKARAPELLLTVREAATRLRCRRETLRRYIAEGLLPALALPNGYYRIRERDLEQLLKPAGPEGAGGSPQPN